MANQGKYTGTSVMMLVCQTNCPVLPSTQTLAALTDMDLQDLIAILLALTPTTTAPVVLSPAPSIEAEDAPTLAPYMPGYFRHNAILYHLRRPIIWCKHHRNISDLHLPYEYSWAEWPHTGGNQICSTYRESGGFLLKSFERPFTSGIPQGVKYPQGYKRKTSKW